MRRRSFVLAGAAALTAGAAPGGIRIGCQTRAWGSPIRDRARLLQILEELAAAGYAGFETNFASLEHSFDDPVPMRREIEKRGVPLIGLHAGGPPSDPRILRVARAVKALGGNYLMLSGSGSPDSAALERKCQELEMAGRACAELGVQLCYHNHAPELEHGAREIGQIARRTRLLVDMSYVFLAGMDAPGFFRRHSGQIAGIHVRDMTAGREVDMGAGQFDYRGLAHAIGESGWQGWVIVEMNQRPGESSREMVEKARRYVREELKLG